MAQPNKRERTAFVTVGTTLFEGLIQAMVDPRVLDKLSDLGFTKLVLQYGKGTKPVLSSTSPPPARLKVEMYDFKKTLVDDMQRADWIVGHAGAGTVSEALSYENKKLVVVINTALMHNHQTELAHAMRDRHHLFVVDNAADLLDANTWERIADFQPVPLRAGDPYDFPRLLDAFLAEA